MRIEEVITLYQAVSDLTDQMLVAARARDWEQFCELESNCASHVEIIRNQDTAVALPDPVREQKVRIIHQILAHDRAIRDITEPWMAQLSAMINSAGAEHKLSKAYGAAPRN
ncbi:MAG: flagellar protein FliT [Pseudomonadota bacterium]